jgi:hypothetical protein
MYKWQSDNPPGADPDSFDPHTPLAMEAVEGVMRGEVPLPAKAAGVLGGSARVRFDTSDWR